MNSIEMHSNLFMHILSLRLIIFIGIGVKRNIRNDSINFHCNKYSISIDAIIIRSWVENEDISNYNRSCDIIKNQLKMVRHQVNHADKTMFKYI